MEFSKKVKKVRKKLGLSQRELAQALSVSFATINRWENGHVIPSNLAKKSFYDFCESNFINLEEIDNE
ncbi:helix-turn-helix domain-containing protein [Enterocloster clostridioformis]|uniref:helix-turn-helix domain-containing protein n=1 Tax=Enterocloster clostridioformis TaxID=1531 RepID=UPI000481358D|nr:helix-turn-helix transcriptional regulator [Enterocloster clostridioformis]